MRIHKEGHRFLFFVVLFFIVLDLVVYQFLPQTVFLLCLVLSVILVVFLFSFFRDPARTVPLNENHVIAPADGKVVVIEKVHEKKYFNEERIQVSIFMSPLNVHINRVPISGKVVFDSYDAGKYLVAWHPKSSELNERTTVVIENSNNQQILLRQIAGALAKRIVLYLKKGMHVEQGQEMGFIKFGSRVDIFLPLDANVRVALNEKVTGGETVLAEI
ncbi:MAG: phosphatidylserine decarboxylase family protein [Bacteroidia bacterium]